MINRKLALKIKVKHLTQESKIIRKEELRVSQPTKQWLYEHRIVNVRNEARATHIAYAHSRGTPLSRVEKDPSSIPYWIVSRVKKMIKLYSNNPMGFDEYLLT